MYLAWGMWVQLSPVPPSLVIGTGPSVGVHDWHSQGFACGSGHQVCDCCNWTFPYLPFDENYEEIFVLKLNSFVSSRACHKGKRRVPFSVSLKGCQKWTEFLSESAALPLCLIFTIFTNNIWCANMESRDWVCNDYLLAAFFFFSLPCSVEKGKHVGFLLFVGWVCCVVFFFCRAAPPSRSDTSWSYASQRCLSKCKRSCTYWVRERKSAQASSWDCP